MKINIRWLILAVITAVLAFTCILFYLSAQKSSNILKDSNIQTGIQNFSIAYDEAKRITIVGAYVNTLQAFNENGEKLWDFDTNGPVREIKLEEESRKAYIGCEDRNVYVLDIDKGTMLGVINVQRRIYGLDINADASLIAVSAGQTPIKHGLYVYDNKGNEVWKKDIGSISRKVTFNSDYSKIYLVSDRADVMQFDLKGNQIGSTKLDYAIADIYVDRSSALIAVLTGKCTYYLFDETFKQIAYSAYEGTGRSIAASKNMEWVAIGTEEGRFYITDKEGIMLFRTFIDNNITGILFYTDNAYMTGTGDFIYELDLEALKVINIFNALKSNIQYLFYVLPILLLIFIILAFEAFKMALANAFKTMMKHKVAYLMLVPTFVLLIVFAYIPVIRAFAMSFTDWNVNQKSFLEIKFIGLDNFKLMISEGYFLLGVKNLLILIGTTFIKVLTVPLLVAELVFLTSSNRRKYWFRFLFVLPMVVPYVVTTLMWKNIYDPNIGLLKNLLQVMNLESLQRVWLGDPATAIWAIVFVGFPFIDAFAFLIYYGGLINISPELFEAAKTDGSNGWWNFIRIHIPMITPHIKMLIILFFIVTVQNFTHIFILTSGGPGVATYVPGLELYNNATAYGRYGYACALGVIMFIAIFLGTWLSMKMRTASENEF